jgi:hypothetical protein
MFPKTRRLVNSQEPVDAADDTSNCAADNASNGPSNTTSLVSSSLHSLGDALSLRGACSQKRCNNGNSPFFLHQMLPKWLKSAGNAISFEKFHLGSPLSAEATLVAPRWPR